MGEQEHSKTVHSPTQEGKKPKKCNPADGKMAKFTMSLNMCTERFQAIVHIIKHHFFNIVFENIPNISAHLKTYKTCLIVV